jgi:hypothetical protein
VEECDTRGGRITGNVSGVTAIRRLRTLYSPSGLAPQHHALIQRAGRDEVVLVDVDHVGDESLVARNLEEWFFAVYVPAIDGVVAVDSKEEAVERGVYDLDMQDGGVHAVDDAVRAVATRLHRTGGWKGECRYLTDREKVKSTLHQ